MARPVVAAEAGKVSYATSGLGGCMLYLYGRSGTMYMHPPEQRPHRENDNRGGCVKDVTYAVPNGAVVSSGEQVAWNGDSATRTGTRTSTSRCTRAAARTRTVPAPEAWPPSALRRAAGVSVLARPPRDARRAGAATVEIEVDRVRRYPGGSWLRVPARTVELAVPADAVIPAEAPRRRRGVTRRGFKTSVPVTAFTLKAKTTTDAISAPRRPPLGRLAPSR